jgi:acetyl esterase/lipase
MPTRHPNAHSTDADGSGSGLRGGPRPPFDPELTGPLEVLSGYLPPLSPDGIDAARAAAAAMTPPTAELTRGGMFALEEHLADGYHQGGPPVRLLLLRPVTAVGAVPVMYHIHGGGMVLGDAASGLDVVLDLAVGLGAAVVSVDYRLAPEHPYPAPLEDCFAGLSWLAGHAAGLDLDADRVVVAGASAGGGLAAGLALLARDHGSPALLGQMLWSPMLDDRNDTASAHQMAGAGLWDRASNATGWNALLDGRSGEPEVPPYAAPARAADLAGLPPAFLDVGSAETFRDETVSYASRLWAVGGQAELHVWPGGFHGFAVLVPDAALSRDANEASWRWLRRLLDQA